MSGVAGDLLLLVALVVLNAAVWGVWALQLWRNRWRP